MILTRLGHATLLIQTSDARILIDPGTLSSEWHGVGDLDAILITHQHADHVDVDHLPGLLDANPGARLVVERAVADMVPEGAETTRAGDRLEFGGLSVEVVGEQHAQIHERFPGVGNVGFIVREGGGPATFHPGDSYDTTPSGIDVLALPLAAPWARAAMTVDFANAVNAERVVPIHDAHLSDAGQATFLRVIGGLLEESTAVEDPPVGESYNL